MQVRSRSNFGRRKAGGTNRMDDYPARRDDVRPPDERPATIHYTMMLPTSRAERLGFIVRAALAVAAVFVGLFIIWKIYEALLLVLLAIVFATVLMAAADRCSAGRTCRTDGRWRSSRSCWPRLPSASAG